MLGRGSDNVRQTLHLGSGTARSDFVNPWTISGSVDVRHYRRSIVIKNVLGSISILFLKDDRRVGLGLGCIYHEGTQDPQGASYTQDECWGILG